MLLSAKTASSSKMAAMINVDIKGNLRFSRSILAIANFLVISVPYASGFVKNFLQIQTAAVRPLFGLVDFIKSFDFLTVKIENELTFKDGIVKLKGKETSKVQRI